MLLHVQVPQPANNTAVCDTADGDVAVVDSTTEPEDDGPGLRGGKGKGQRGGRRGYNKNRQYDGRDGRDGYRGNWRYVNTLLFLITVLTVSCDVF